MKPNGFVAAASTTSQTSIDIRSQSCASSLTSAMLTERKMFSSSFVSSAASGVDTSTTVSIARAVDVGRALRALGRDPAEHLRRRLRRPVLAARIDALRRHREMEVRRPPSARALLEDRLQHLARRSRPRRRLEHDDLALAQHLGDPARRRLDDREVRLALAGERRRQRDQDRLGVLQLGVVGRGADQAVLDERLAAARSRRPRCGSRRGSAPSTTGSTTSTSSTRQPASAKVVDSGRPT